MTELSKEYLEALEKSGQVGMEYHRACAMYRRCELDDNEFLSIRNAFNEAQLDFDKAYEKEQRRIEQVELEARLTPEQIMQLELLK